MATSHSESPDAEFEGMGDYEESFLADWWQEPKSKWDAGEIVDWWYVLILIENTFLSVSPPSMPKNSATSTFPTVVRRKNDFKTSDSLLQAEK